MKYLTHFLEFLVVTGLMVSLLAASIVVGAIL